VSGEAIVCFVIMKFIFKVSNTYWLWPSWTWLFSTPSLILPVTGEPAALPGAGAHHLRDQGSRCDRIYKQPGHAWPAFRYPLPSISS
jgi:hypothetical protein